MRRTGHFRTVAANRERTKAGICEGRHGGMMPPTLDRLVSGVIALPTLTGMAPQRELKTSTRSTERR